MTAESIPTTDRGAPSELPWTCPFCALLCDSHAVRPGSAPTLVGSACPIAQEALAGAAAGLRDTSGPRVATSTVDGAPVAYTAALDAAAAVLAASRQPLFAGLATDLAGVRGLYRLANRCGAILDHARGDALMHSTRALQDRGVFYTTLAEIRNRADLIVCLGTNPAEHYPEFFRRCAPAADAEGERQVVFLGADAPVGGVAPAGLDAFRSEAIRLADLVGQAADLFTAVAILAARLAGRRVASTSPALESLVARMQAARYTVIVWESGRLSAHGALIAEGIQRLVNTLNRSTRAAAFCLGGSDGGYTANQVLTWLSGLPLRTAVRPGGLVHEPQRYATARLLADRAVDALLWVASFAPDLVPPVVPTAAKGNELPTPSPLPLPTVVLGHPEMAEKLGGRLAQVFIPVSTPGIGAPGHLFRADGGVVVPLTPLYADPLPTVAQVATDLAARLAARVPPGRTALTGDPR